MIEWFRTHAQGLIFVAAAVGAIALSAIADWAMLRWVFGA